MGVNVIVFCASSARLFVFCETQQNETNLSVRRRNYDYRSPAKLENAKVLSENLYQKTSILRENVLVTELLSEVMFVLEVSDD